MARKSYRVKFAGGDGLSQLAGIIDRPDDVATPPVVVYSHCFTCNKDLKSTVRVSRGLSELGVAVLRFDMMGLGGSEGDFSSSNFTTNLADLSAAIRFASAEMGTVTGLMGHSFGGAASLAIAADNPNDDLPPIQAVASLAAPSDTTHLADLLESMNPAIQSTGVGDVTIGGFQWTIRREMLGDFRQYDLPKYIAQIACPVLLMHSPVDQTVRFDHALRIMSLINGSPHLNSPVSLLSLDQADHLLANDQRDVNFVASSAAAFFHRFCDTGRGM
ncbi:MAG: alpha/beta fold hydrolase [Pirellulaceae bacterium]